MRIKKGDTVMVITGKDKGKHGKVLKAMPKENRVVVEGVNMQTKHAKATSKINELFYCKYIKNDGTEESKKKYENEGGEDLANAFEEVLGIDIQYRVHVNWAALIQAIDAIGGIDVVFTYGDQTWLVQRRI